MFFYWMTPLMTTGASRYITEEDMYNLLPEDHSNALGKRLQDYFNRQKTRNKWALFALIAS